MKDLIDVSEELTALPENEVSIDVEREERQTPPATEEAETPVTPTVDYAALAREDLLAIKSEFPECAGMKDLSELENPLRYGALRDMGLSVREAYLATTTPRSQARADNRAHLTSAVPRRSEHSGDELMEEDMQKMRLLFGKLSDREIRKLYKKVNA